MQLALGALLGLVCLCAGYWYGFDFGWDASKKHTADNDPMPAGTPIPLSVKQEWNRIPHEYLEHHPTYEEAYAAYTRHQLWDAYERAKDRSEAEGQNWIKRQSAERLEVMFMGQYPDELSICECERGRRHPDDCGCTREP